MGYRFEADKLGEQGPIRRAPPASRSGVDPTTAL